MHLDYKKNLPYYAKYIKTCLSVARSHFKSYHPWPPHHNYNSCIDASWAHSLTWSTVYMYPNYSLFLLINMLPVYSLKCDQEMSSACQTKEILNYRD